MKLHETKNRIIRIWLILLFLPILFYISAPAVLAAVNTGCANGQHQYTEISRAAATETQDGAIRYRCKLCSHEYTEILFATDHLWGEWIIDKPPTCTAPGDRHRICKRGKTHEEYTTIPALGHDYIESITSEPGCETEGVKTFTCSRCGDNHTEAIPVSGHEYSEEITKKPSCFEDGLKSFICTHDHSHTYTEAIPSYGSHKFGKWYEETSAAEGIPGTEARICSRDGFKETQEIPALPVKELTTTEDTNNTADIILIGADIALAGTFTFLIRPYARCIRYIKKRRKTVERLKNLREMVEKLYDFK